MEDKNEWSKKPNRSQEIIERAKKLLPLQELILRVGDADRVAANLCPFHDDHSPSFSCFEFEGQELWKCHAGCGTGDQINYLEIKLEISRGEAIRKFLAMAGIRKTGGGGRFYK